MKVRKRQPAQVSLDFAQVSLDFAQVSLDFAQVSLDFAERPLTQQSFACAGCSAQVFRVATFQGMLRPELCFDCYDATQARRPR